MRTILTLLLVSGMAFGQSAEQKRAKLPPQGTNAPQSDKGGLRPRLPQASKRHPIPTLL